MTQDSNQSPPDSTGAGSQAKPDPESTPAGSGPSADTAPPEAPYDKKRVALLNGACGQADRVRICGQVVDIPVTRNQKFDEWDNLHNLPNGLRQAIRPIEDFTMMSVRRPRLQLEVLRIAAADLDADDAATRLEQAEVVYCSDVIVAAGDGFFAHTLDANTLEKADELAPGQYVVRVILRGIDSIRQSVADLAYIGNSDSLILKNDIAIGYGRLRVLPADFSGRLLTSDIDQTFLDTPIHSTQGLMETLFETPAAKRPIFALPEFYRQLQNHFPLIFISASPHFFRRTLSAVFEHHEIEFSGLHLKYLLSTFDNIVKKFTETMLNLNDFLGQGLGASFERSLKFLGSSVMSLFDHVSYKLITLLENRLMQPTGTREILMGDNKESDFFIFSLYQALLLGDLKGHDLESYLYRLNFLDREALTRDAAKRIAELTEANLKVHGPLNPVDAVWINLSRDEPDDTQMRELVTGALPPASQADFADESSDRFQRPRACRGGVGFAMAAHDEGLIDDEQLLRILRSGEGGVYQEGVVDRVRLAKFIREFRRRDTSKLDADDIIARITTSA